MQTGEFLTAVAQLKVSADTTRLALMCVEKGPPCCHRSMIADYPSTFGIRIIHLVGRGDRTHHRLSVLARRGREGIELIYYRCQTAQRALRI
jgi:hypothetical protein